jgi:hypothetical protein
MSRTAQPWISAFMIMKTHAVRREKILRDLMFEIELPEPKFLVAICNGTGKVADLIRTLDNRLAGTGKRAVSIPVEAFKTGLRTSLMRAIKDVRADVLHLTNISSLGKDPRRRFFSELNFQRDALSQLGLPIVVWLTKSEVQQLAALAPDFWSRRHAVYSFEASSIPALLSRIFSKKRAATKTAGVHNEISKALTDVLAAERELRACLQHRSQFSLGRADELIQRIRRGVEQLETAIRKGRQIEVAMWLWNIAHLDEALEQATHYAESSNRQMYESIYTDRNEALLFMAENIDRVLSDYSDTLEETIREKARSAS